MIQSNDRTFLCRESGSALVVSLILLVVLTMLGVQGMRTNVMQERMAGNMRERSSAFQAAEAALREGERQLSAGLVTAGAQLLDPANPATWQALNFPTPASGVVIANFNNALAEQPSFYAGQRLYYDDIDGIPEPTWCPHVITSHGTGAQADSRVILESFFLPQAGACN